jgi:hypothetical protein
MSSFFSEKSPLWTGPSSCILILLGNGGPPSSRKSIDPKFHNVKPISQFWNNLYIFKTGIIVKGKRTGHSPKFFRRIQLQKGIGVVPSFVSWSIGERFLFGNRKVFYRFHQQWHIV